MKFNYSNLNYVEFEELCKDIMQKKLGVELRLYKSGKDSGIDLKDNEDGNNIVIQVKHYINSSYSDLKGALKREVEKVKKLKPNRYFICCSTELTPNNLEEIYNLFKDYMDSKENIITIKEIDSFLAAENNNDIVRKHFKLWLSGSNILTEVDNQNIFIDCESLLSDIEEESKYYVETEVYRKCLDMIDNERMVIITGSPGVGKTITSKMIVLYYANLGYRVRYTTNGDIRDLKRALSLDKDKKEIILLDDYLGQCYFKMKDNQENEIISLIKYIKMHKSKRLILNSRVTIMNEAREKYEEFDKFILKNNSLIYTINMDNMSIYEKAKILYNHIYFNNMPKKYYENIVYNENYLKIIKHSNYTPRIIEYICEYCRYKDREPEKYMDFVMKTLNNPEKIWQNEYEYRIEKLDRIFINVLYSLTDTEVEMEILEECFNKRIENDSEIDGTINNFEKCLTRLNKSMIKIIDVNNIKKVSVLNPSVNDFIKNIFYKNKELELIKKSIVYYEQIIRCYDKDEIENVIKEKINDKSFIKLKIKNRKINKNIEILLLYYICKFKIFNEYYIDLIGEYIFKIENKEKENYIYIDECDIYMDIRSYVSDKKDRIGEDNGEKILQDIIGEDIIFESIENKQNKKDRWSTKLSEFYLICSTDEEELLEEYINKEIKKYILEIENITNSEIEKNLIELDKNINPKKYTDYSEIDFGYGKIMENSNEKEKFNIINQILSDEFFYYYKIDKYIEDLDFLNLLLSLKIEEVYIIYNKLINKTSIEFLENMRYIIIDNFIEKINLDLEDLAESWGNSFFEYINFRFGMLTYLSYELNEIKRCLYDKLGEYIINNMKYMINKIKYVVNRIDDKFIQTEINLYLKNIVFGKSFKFKYNHVLHHAVDYYGRLYFSSHDYSETTDLEEEFRDLEEDYRESVMIDNIFNIDTYKCK